MKRAAATQRIHLTSMRWERASPIQTAGTSAINIPRVVPITTATSESYRAASATVASWVLSPISMRKKETTVVTKTPAPRTFRSPSSSSALRAQKPKRMKESATTHRRVPGATRLASQTPIQPARKWLASVATRMPRTIGTRRLSFAASAKERSCVLSPISARATTETETRKASISR